VRIAFLTPEYVTELPDGGGLGNYLSRLGTLLLKEGHEPEIFVASELEPQTLIHNGVLVQRVPSSWAPGNSLKLVRRLCGVLGAETAITIYARARALAAALERRHRMAPFQMVQSADFLAVALRVRRIPTRVHVVRCSLASDLYNEVDGNRSASARWCERLERAAMRRADRVYAPSRLIAEHFNRRHGIAVTTLRPPIEPILDIGLDLPVSLPDRFLVYFGQFNRRKGTEWLGAAFKKACDAEPALRMVWIGRDYGMGLSRVLSDLGLHRSKVLVLHPLPKAELYAVVRHAEAALLPSLVDNLPNTMIESLKLGIPVIGTRGASIDELVRHGVTGELVPVGDVGELAAAMLRVWRNQSSVKKGFIWRDEIAYEMDPHRAIENLLQLAAPTRKP
jgi:glycosyltransferase involved in cell wall biosynthesis